jgi:hypothetical protein
MKKLLVLLLTVSLILGLAYFIYNLSFIEISIINSRGEGEITYSLLNQEDMKLISGKTTSPTIKKRVSRGSYEVSITQNGSGYFTVTKTKGLMNKTSVSATLKQENSRQFVGDNPGSCTYFFNKMLVSSACSDTMDKLVRHVPATAQTPTYAINAQKPTIAGDIEGDITLESGHYFLVQKHNRETNTNSQTLISTDANLEIKKQVPLRGLDQNITYSIKAFKDGFLVYDEHYSNVYYYASPQSRPKAIGTGTPKTRGLDPVSLEAYDDKIIKLYSSAQDQEGKSEVILTAGGVSEHFVFDKNYTSAIICGASTICVLGGAGLEAYDVSDSKANYAYKITGVSAVANTKDAILVANKIGILNMDIGRAAGYYEFTFGEYRLNGIASRGNVSDYTLRLSNNKNRAIAVQVDQTSSNTDSIDKKIIELQKIPQISFVSIYGKYIYVGADLGELINDPSTGRLNYDPRVKQNAASSINVEIDRIGIDRKKYVITSNAF